MHGWRQLARVGAMLAIPVLAGAQAATTATGELTGRITTAAERPVGGATIRLIQGATVRETRADDDGRYRLTGLADGNWIQSVQAVGYQRSVGRIAFAGPRMERDVALVRLPTQLDSVVIAGRWSGLRIVVGDAAAQTALADARVRIVGPQDTSAITDASGRVEFERTPNADVTFTVERDGFARRIVQAKVPARGAAEVIVTLDSAGPKVNDEMEWQDMRLRLRAAGVRAFQVGRDEVLRSGASALKDALRTSPAMTRQGVVAARDACVFIDGVAKPGLPIDGISVDLVDFVEVYPFGSDHSRTLALRWPPGGVCGAPNGGVEELHHQRDKVQYVVVWTRKGRRP